MVPRDVRRCVWDRTPNGTRARNPIWALRRRRPHPLLKTHARRDQERATGKSDATTFLPPSPNDHCSYATFAFALTLTGRCVRNRVGWHGCHPRNSGIENTANQVRCGRNGRPFAPSHNAGPPAKCGISRTQGVAQPAQVACKAPRTPARHIRAVLRRPRGFRNRRKSSISWQLDPVSPRSPHALRAPPGMDRLSSKPLQQRSDEPRTTAGEPQNGIGSARPRFACAVSEKSASRSGHLRLSPR
ncbi:hypothetical protein LXA43DRAFT_631264 [Ganoderma leucocontextum]|nr:hypothetical protein LXA43DRAFT_631264 [Ganoderma leucocontextum]